MYFQTAHVRSCFMTQVKSYANFNSVTFQGRVSNVDIVEGQYGEFLAVTVLTNVADDDTVSVVFNDSKGLLALHKSGWLPVGRQVTIVGRLRSVSETYFDKKSGQTMMRKRPQISLEEVSIPKGGLGAMPAEKAPEAAPKRGMVVSAPATKQAPVDHAPELQAVGPKPYGEGTAKDKNGFPQF